MKRQQEFVTLLNELIHRDVDANHRLIGEMLAICKSNYDRCRDEYIRSSIRRSFETKLIIDTSNNIHDKYTEQFKFISQSIWFCLSCPSEEDRNRTLETISEEINTLITDLNTFIHISEQAMKVFDIN